jgi:hypothetical protein
MSPGVPGPANGLKPHQGGCTLAVIVSDVYGEANLSPYATAADRTGQQPTDIKQPARFVLADDSGRHGHAAQPGGPGERDRVAEPRFRGGRRGVDQNAGAERVGAAVAAEDFGIVNGRLPPPTAGGGWADCWHGRARRRAATAAREGGSRRARGNLFSRRIRKSRRHTGRPVRRWTQTEILAAVGGTTQRRRRARCSCEGAGLLAPQRR